jgi:hypothetical protein
VAELLEMCGSSGAVFEEIGACDVEWTGFKSLGKVNGVSEMVTVMWFFGKDVEKHETL